MIVGQIKEEAKKRLAEIEQALAATKADFDKVAAQLEREREELLRIVGGNGDTKPASTKPAKTTGSSTMDAFEKQLREAEWLWPGEDNVWWHYPLITNIIPF